VGVLIAALAIGFGGCAPRSTPSAEESTFVVGSTVDVDSWNEYLSGQSFAVSLHRRIWLRLAQEAGAGPDGIPRWEPLIADSWDRSPDGRSLTFRLREMVWSDGTPLTSGDVRFSWLAQTSPAVAWVGAGSKSGITDVETPDPRTAVFRFERPYPEQFADAVDGGILPAHVFGAVPFEQWRSHDWSRVRIGSGPFLLAKHLPGEQIVLEKNPLYFKTGRPFVNRVVIRIVPDSSNLLSQFLSGRLDWLEGVAPQDADRIGDLPGARVIALDAPGFDYVGWNGTKPPFDDPQIRRALSLAIDRDALVRDLLYGYGRVSKGPIPSSFWAAPLAPPTVAFDPEEARRLLAERGFSSERPLRFELMTNAGNRLREAVVVKLQDLWGRVGVQAVPRIVESRTLRERASAGDYDAFLAGWRFSEKIDLAAIFGSAALPPAGANVVRYAPAELDGLLARLQASEDIEDARAAYHDIASRVVRDHPYTFLYEPQRIVAVGTRVKEFQADVHSDPLARVDSMRIRSGDGLP
jgi:peptide/nickel transport system substrate-binding protein